VDKRLNNADGPALKMPAHNIDKLNCASRGKDVGGERFHSSRALSVQRARRQREKLTNSNKVSMDLLLCFFFASESELNCSHVHCYSVFICSAEKTLDMNKSHRQVNKHKTYVSEYEEDCSCSSCECSTCADEGENKLICPSTTVLIRTDYSVRLTSESFLLPENDCRRTIVLCMWYHRHST
jgi:hypothetical protein